MRHYPYTKRNVEWLEGNCPDFQALEVYWKIPASWQNSTILVKLKFSLFKYSPEHQHLFTTSQYARHQLSVKDHNSRTVWDYKRNTSGGVVTKIQYSKSSKYWVSKPVRKNKQKKYLQEMMEKVVEIIGENITLDTPNLPKTSNVVPTPRPEIMYFRKIVRSRFI